MGHFNDQYIDDCDSRANDDDNLDRRAGVSSKPALPISQPAHYTKTITPAFEQVGKRKRLTGYIGELCNETTCLHFKEYSTYSQAETALDALAFDLLSALSKQGLTDELTSFDPTTCCFCSKPHSPQSCPEMRALLFAPDAPIICSMPDNFCDVHSPCPAHAADAARYLASEVCFDQYGIASDLTPCPDCGKGICECDLGSDEWNMLHSPDVDFVSVGWEA